MGFLFLHLGKTGNSSLIILAALDMNWETTEKLLVGFKVPN